MRLDLAHFQFNSCRNATFVLINAESVARDNQVNKFQAVSTRFKVTYQVKNSFQDEI